MNMNQQDLRPGEEEALQGLLREMAPEAEPAPDVRERIRLAVAAEWRAAVTPVPALSSAASARAARRWQRPAMALAASLAVAAVALGIYQSNAPTAPPVAATLVRLSGPVEAGIDSGWQPVNPGQAIAVGQKLVTGPRGKAALALRRGVTLRLDANTRIALAGIDRVVVERGAVYLDSGDRPAAGPGVRIETAFGSTRHLGTQYEVRVLPAEMQVSVREGRVETAPDIGQAPVVAQAGEQVVIGTGGNVARRAVDRRDPRWNWIADVTPPYAIEDRRLAEFLAWVCRETGRELTFTTPGAEAAAQSIILRGSVAGLSPDEALAAVMATTNLTYKEEDGRLIVQPAVRQAATR
ncbi:MAG: FecR domain-containing protein [Chromatiales bacterium]|nr:FecR domain-containing protein [Chromatiales bacterium]